MALVWFSLLYASLGALLWVYAVYPLVVGFLAWRRPGVPPESIGTLPGVTVIVAVHNEEAVITRKLDNTLAFYYLRDRLEILFASDGSSDATGRMLEQYASRGVHSIIVRTHVGKTEAQNRAAAVAGQPILFFTDATTMHAPDVLHRI